MLTFDDWKLLRFEEQLGSLPRWRKETAVRRDLGISLIRYNQRLAHLIQDADALAEFPQLVYRLRAVAEKRDAEARARLISRDA